MNDQKVHTKNNEAALFFFAAVEKEKLSERLHAVSFGTTA